tara:strand:+ start:9682 stop:9921 length:240 start_codon:yes stop_codon:yes gene_type:complete
MKALKSSKGAKSGGRPKKEKKLVDVRKYLPWMKRVAQYQIVYSQLDSLQYDLFTNIQFDEREVQKRIAQIKKDISNIKL